MKTSAYLLIGVLAGRKVGGPTLVAGVARGSDSVMHASIGLDGHSTEAACSAPPGCEIAARGTSQSACGAGRTTLGVTTDIQRKIFNNRGSFGGPHKTCSAFDGCRGGSYWADKLASVELAGAGAAVIHGWHGLNASASLGDNACAEAANKDMCIMNVRTCATSESRDANVGNKSSEFSLEEISAHAWKGVAVHAAMLECPLGSDREFLFPLAEALDSSGTCDAGGGETLGQSRPTTEIKQGEKLLIGARTFVRAIVDKFNSLMTAIKQGQLRPEHEAGADLSQMNAAESAVLSGSGGCGGSSGDGGGGSRQATEAALSTARRTQRSLQSTGTHGAIIGRKGRTVQAFAHPSSASELIGAETAPSTAAIEAKLAVGGAEVNGEEHDGLAAQIHAGKGRVGTDGGSGSSPPGLVVASTSSPGADIDLVIDPSSGVTATVHASATAHSAGTRAATLRAASTVQGSNTSRLASPKALPSGLVSSCQMRLSEPTLACRADAGEALDTSWATGQQQLRPMQGEKLLQTGARGFVRAIVDKISIMAGSDPWYRIVGALVLACLLTLLGLRLPGCSAASKASEGKKRTKRAKKNEVLAAAGGDSAVGDCGTHPSFSRTRLFFYFIAMVALCGVAFEASIVEYNLTNGTAPGCGTMPAIPPVNGIDGPESWHADAAGKTLKPGMWVR